MATNTTNAATTFTAPAHVPDYKSAQRRTVRDSSIGIAITETEPGAILITGISGMTDDQLARFADLLTFWKYGLTESPDKQLHLSLA